jgi:hypothetical protein
MSLFFSSKWTDSYLKANFPKVVLDTVEMAKKETRTAAQTGMNLETFLEDYNTTDMYTVSAVPYSMQRDVALPAFLNCGGYTNYLDSSIMWFSSGGTKSVIHNDGQDNVNCLFSGRKRLAFFHPVYKTTIETKENGWVVAERDLPSAYGAFSGLDVENMDLKKYPKWGEIEWYDAQMEEGDCLYIPTSWWVPCRARSVRCAPASFPTRCLSHPNSISASPHHHRYCNFPSSSSTTTTTYYYYYYYYSYSYYSRYHSVWSEERNLAVNIWWWRSDGKDTSEDTSKDTPEDMPEDTSKGVQSVSGGGAFECSLSSEPLSLADCTWGYEPGNEHQFGKVRVSSSSGGMNQATSTNSGR